MKKYNVLITDKETGEVSVLKTVDTEAEATRECEGWGWNYDDGEKSYWMGYSISTDDKLILFTI